MEQGECFSNKLSMQFKFNLSWQDYMRLNINFLLIRSTSQFFCYTNDVSTIVLRRVWLVFGPKTLFNPIELLLFALQPQRIFQIIFLIFGALISFSKTVNAFVHYSDIGCYKY